MRVSREPTHAPLPSPARHRYRCPPHATNVPGWRAWPLVGSLLGSGLLFVALLGFWAQPPALPSAMPLAWPVAHAAVTTPVAPPAVGQATSTASDTLRVYIPMLAVSWQAGSLTMGAAPTTLVANGRTNATVTASLRSTADTDEAPLPERPIRFSTTQGQFENGSSTIVAMTNANGTARATLHISRSIDVLGPAQLTAAYPAVGSTALMTETTVNLVPVMAQSIELVAQPDRILANGSSTTTITATVRDTEGSLLPDYPIQFNTTLGSFPNGDTAIAGQTSSQGVATTVLQSVLDIDTVRATVSAEAQTLAGVVGGETLVRFIPPARIFAIATPNSIDASVASFANIIATVQDTSGAPVADYPVDFVASAGRFTNGSRFLRLTTDATGIAQAELSGTPELTTAQVVAQAGNARSSDLAITFGVGECNLVPRNDLPADQPQRYFPRNALQQPSAICSTSIQEEAEGEVGNHYYIANLEGGQSLSVDLTRIPPGADYDVILYDATFAFVEDENGQPIFSNANGNVDERIEYTKRTGPSESYYIRINMAGKTTETANTYRLTLVRDPLEQPGQVQLATAPSASDSPADGSLTAAPFDPPLPSKP